MPNIGMLPKAVVVFLSLKRNQVARNLNILALVNVKDSLAKIFCFQFGARRGSYRNAIIPFVSALIMRYFIRRMPVRMEQI